MSSAMSFEMGLLNCSRLEDFPAQIRREQPRGRGWSELPEMLREMWENIIREDDCIAFITLNHTYNGYGI